MHDGGGDSSGGGGTFYLRGVFPVVDNPDDEYVSRTVRNNCTRVPGSCWVMVVAVVMRIAVEVNYIARNLINRTNNLVFIFLSVHNMSFV